MPQHLYIHWPFCHTRCSFCDFIAFQGHEDYQETYHRVLCKEIALFASQRKTQNTTPIKTIFVGGGTPSLYPLPWLKELFATLQNNFQIDPEPEITIESNPTDITEERLDAWRECGINRLSIGVQCLDDAVLLKLNRRQRTTDVERTLRIAPKYFDNISVDFILGLPGIEPHAWVNTMQTAVTWPIQHLSVYFLTIYEKTPLAFAVQKGHTNLMNDEIMVDLYEQTIQQLEHHSFEQYEISNFSKTGFESTHNQAYWDRKPYKGFGIGASSFDGQTRSTNTKNLKNYLKTDGQAFSEQETITPKKALLELLMLCLRQKKGLDLHRVVYFLNTDQKEAFEKNIRHLTSQGLLEQENTTIRLSLKGWALENEVIVRLLSNEVLM